VQLWDTTRVWSKVSGERNKIKGRKGAAMNKEEMRKSWHGLGEEAISGMLEWRQQHPKATFREIEKEVDERLGVMRARMLSDAAMASSSREWGVDGKAPGCAQCGKELEKKGKKKRQMQTRGGQEIELEREYGVCPSCGQGIFPPG
jgi:YgiT-type zinc finger domain-containing protein